MRSLWLSTAAVLAQLARKVPLWLAPEVDRWALCMVEGSTRFRRMGRKECQYGKPFLAYAQCDDCDHCWTVVSLGDVYPDNDLVCPVCNQNSGGLL
jgi:hypothetical protein